MDENIKTKKLSITIPEDLWNEIANVEFRGEISEFIVEAAREYLARVKQKRGIEKGFGAWSNESHPELSTPQDTSDYVRSIRDADKSRFDQMSDR